MTSTTTSPSPRGPLGIVTSVQRLRYFANSQGDLARDGYQFIPNALPRADLQRLRDDVCASLTNLPGEAAIHGRTDGRLRMAYGLHLASPIVNSIARQGVWVSAIRNALQRRIYLYQSKLTVNPPHSDAGWGWHYDYVPWRDRDSVPEPRLISAIVFLDDVGTESGGVSVLEGSHRLDATALAELVGRLEARTPGAKDQSVRALSPVGRAGSVLLIHALTMHGSSPNQSDADRRLLIYTYNSCDNLPRTFTSAEWRCARDTTAIA